MARLSDLPDRDRNRSVRVQQCLATAGIDQELRVLFLADLAFWGAAGMVHEPSSCWSAGAAGNRRPNKPVQRGHACLADQPMQYAESADGTRVAYRRFGSGRPVVFVGGALSTAEAAGPLAAAFAEAGLQGVTYDRRGRGGSGDTAPYAPEREAEDLRAVIDAVDGAAVVLGHSSGAHRFRPRGRNRCVRCCRCSRRLRAYR
jgi:hypothetical protein